MPRALALIGITATILAGAAWAVMGDERPVTRATCAADDIWAREQFNAVLDGKRREPYGPYDGRRVVQTLRRAGFVLPAENQLFTLYEFGLRLPDICDFRWFAETNQFANDIAEQGQLKIFVVATPANAAFEHRERIRLAKKYRYRHEVSVFRKGNVVVEYFHKFPDGSSARRDRRGDVRRLVAAL